MFNIYIWDNGGNDGTYIRQDRPTVGGCDYGDSAAGSSTWSKQGK